MGACVPARLQAVGTPEVHRSIFFEHRLGRCRGTLESTASAVGGGLKGRRLWQPARFAATIMTRQSRSPVRARPTRSTVSNVRFIFWRHAAIIAAVAWSDMESKPTE